MNTVRKYGGGELPYGSREIKQVIGDLSGYPFDGWVICNEANRIAYGQDEQGEDIVPNLCGYFLRGMSQVVGEEYPGSPTRYADFQAEAIMPHRHAITRNKWGVGSEGTSMFEASTGLNNSLEANSEYTGGPENRPKNFAVAYIIKII